MDLHRIALMNTLYPPYGLGGAERSVQLLAEALAARGHRVDVITLCDDPWSGPSVENGVRVHRLQATPDIYWPFGRRYSDFGLWCARVRDSYSLAMANTLRELFDTLRPQILHTNNLLGFSVAAWTAARDADIRTVHTCRDYYLFHPQSSLFDDGRDVSPDGMDVRAWSWPRRRASRQVDACVGISQYILDLHRSHGFFPAAITRVIHNGIGMPIIKSASPPATRGSLRVGYLGRIERHKGVEVLFEAASRCARPGGIELVIAGDGPPKYLRHLREQYAGLRTNFLGHVLPERLFEQIDVLVVPSLWQEPFGRVVIESYAHGVPVLAARSGGIPEIVQHGHTGYLFGRGDIRELADLLDGLAEGRLGLSRAACLHYAQRFGHEQVADRYEELYRALLGQGDAVPMTAQDASPATMGVEPVEGELNTAGKRIRLTLETVHNSSPPGVQ